MGTAGSVGIGPWIWGWQIYLTIDANGYMALQHAPYSGMSVGSNSDAFSAAFTPFIMVTNVPSYDALEGSGVQMGGTIPACSVDYVGMLDESGQNILFHGIVLGYGGTSPDVHILGGYTYTLYATKFDWELFFKMISY